jgi:hypothetical protein
MNIYQQTRIYILLLSNLIVLSSCDLIKKNRQQIRLNLKYGDYAIGMIDTIAFKANEIYNYKSYNGDKPFLIKLWYPANKRSAGKEIRFIDLFTTTDTSLVDLYKTLNSADLDYIMQYGILRNIGRGENPNRSTKEDSMYFDLMQMKTMTERNIPMAIGQFPVALYHHGYEGWGHDNYLLAEYLASHGIVVLTSNFEWPGIDSQFNEGNQDITFLVDFINKLQFVDSTRIHAIGHSWGAQAFLHYDKLNRKPFKSIFSIHTTMEHHEIESIPSTWPEVYTVLTDTNRKITQSYIFAPEKPSNNFWAFRKPSTNNFTFINALQPITHEGFISLENFRYFLKDDYKLPDDSLLIKQFETYQEINRYIVNKINNKPLKKEVYSRIYEAD